MYLKVAWHAQKLMAQTGSKENFGLTLLDSKLAHLDQAHSILARTRLNPKFLARSCL